MSYLIFLEHGAVITTESLTDEEKIASDKGLATIVDISKEEPYLYDSGEWVPVANVN